MKRWTQKEADDLRVFFENGYRDAEIADITGRDPESIRTKRYQLGLKRITFSVWTESRIAVLTAMKNQARTNADLADELGVDPATVFTKRKQLGLKTCVYRKWSAEEEQFLRENWPKGAPYVARHIGRKPSSVWTKALQLGLKNGGKQCTQP